LVQLLQAKNESSNVPGSDFVADHAVMADYDGGKASNKPNSGETNGGNGYEPWASCNNVGTDWYGPPKMDNPNPNYVGYRYNPSHYGPVQLNNQQPNYNQCYPQRGMGRGSNRGRGGWNSRQSQNEYGRYDNQGYQQQAANVHQPQVSVPVPHIGPVHVGPRVGQQSQHISVSGGEGPLDGRPLDNAQTNEISTQCQTMSACPRGKVQVPVVGCDLKPEMVVQRTQTDDMKPTPVQALLSSLSSKKLKRMKKNAKLSLRRSQRQKDLETGRVCNELVNVDANQEAIGAANVEHTVRKKSGRLKTDGNCFSVDGMSRNTCIVPDSGCDFSLISKDGADQILTHYRKQSRRMSQLRRNDLQGFQRKRRVCV
jgi:hypothetical protein